MQSRGMHSAEQGVGVMCKAEGCRRHSKERVPTANRLHVHTSKVPQRSVVDRCKGGPTRQAA